MPSKNGNATIADVARVARVSVSTVSRVINDKGDVSPRAREAVRRALAATSYAVSPVARSLVGGRTRLLGLYAQHPTGDYGAALVPGILDVSEDSGYGVLWFAAAFNAQAHGAPLVRSLTDGLLVVSPTMDSEVELSLLLSERPVVFIEPWEHREGYGSVTATNFEGAAEATRYLLGLGHRRIGFVSGPITLSSSRERLSGFRATLADAGLNPDPQLIQEGQFDQESGLVAGRRLLRLTEPPTAIFASDDAEAFGVLWAAHEAGLRVPGDLSVVGFDDVPMAERVLPALTTVNQPLREMGQRAAEILIDWIDGSPPEPRQHILPTRLVVRDSCAPPRSLP